LHFCSIQSTSPNRVHPPIRSIHTANESARIAPKEKSKKSTHLYLIVVTLALIPPITFSGEMRGQRSRKG
jgi:hypothetical protein